MLTLSFKLLSNSRLSGHKIQLTRRLWSNVNDTHFSVFRSIDMFTSGRCCWFKGLAPAPKIDMFD